jgi:hypothetical protein
VYVNSDCDKMHGDYRIKFIKVYRQINFHFDVQLTVSGTKTLAQMPSGSDYNKVDMNFNINSLFYLI